MAFVATIQGTCIIMTFVTFTPEGVARVASAVAVVSGHMPTASEKRHAASVSEGGYPCGYLVPMLEMGCNMHMRAFLYKLAYVCKSPAYGEGTAVAVQW